MRAGKDSLAVPMSAKWENRKTLARDYGTSRRASGWAGENVARSGGLIQAILEKRQRASLEKISLVLAAALHGIRRVLARRGWAGENRGLFEHPVGGAFSSIPRCEGNRRSAVPQYFSRSLLGMFIPGAQ
jgi:hypothetical protein